MTGFAKLSDPNLAVFWINDTDDLFCISFGDRPIFGVTRVTLRGPGAFAAEDSISVHCDR